MADVNLYYGQHFRKNHKNIFEEKIIENFGNENLTLKMAIFLFRPCPRKASLKYVFSVQNAK